MIFRQLFESISSTYTYLLGCPDSGQAVLIDPVLETVERDKALVEQLGLKLNCVIDTHIHADHLTGAHRLKQLTGCNIGGPAKDNLSCRDIELEEGLPLLVGSIEIQPLYTPGHTGTHFAYLVDRLPMPFVFTGDSLLIDGCGRTDFQSGDAETLFNSIYKKLFTLPEHTLVYPGHDYEGRRVSTIEQERTRNPRLGGGKSLKEFVGIMNNLDLSEPEKMHFAVKGKEMCGVFPPNMPELE